MAAPKPGYELWHDLIPEGCTCEAAWADRDLVDDSCWNHKAIEVLDWFGFGPLLADWENNDE